MAKPLLEELNVLVSNASYEELPGLEKFFSDMSWKCIKLRDAMDAAEHSRIHQPLYREVLSKLQERAVANNAADVAHAKNSNRLVDAMAQPSAAMELARSQTDKAFPRRAR